TTRKKIENFAQPPIITTFETKQDALNAFNKKPEPELPLKSEAPAPSSPQAPLQLTKEEIKKREEALLGKLRAELTAMESENQILRKQLIHLAFQRTDPPDAEAFKTKIESLESELQVALEKFNKDPKNAVPAKK
ncbi:MAG: hypothetical protein AAB425_11445, partial [Bdellovibrionota bacterium]